MGLSKTSKYRLTEAFFNYYYQLYLDPVSESYDLTLKRGNVLIDTSVAGRSWQALKKIQKTAASSPVLQIDHETGYSYLKVGTFDSYSLQRAGFDYSSFLEKCFSDLKERQVNHLILDLRGNGGGKDQFGALLVSYLLETPFRYFHRIEVTESYQGYDNVEYDEGQHLMTSHSGLDTQQVQTTNFKGNLYLLIDGWTFSTAADVASVIDSHHRAAIIGEETGGGRDGNTSGASKKIVLNNSGIVINLPMWKYTTAREEQEELGRGVVPDVEVVSTIQQLIDGIDPQLNHCLRLIKKESP